MEIKQYKTVHRVYLNLTEWQAFIALEDKMFKSLPQKENLHERIAVLEAFDVDYDERQGTFIEFSLEEEHAHLLPGVIHIIQKYLQRAWCEMYSSGRKTCK